MYLQYLFPFIFGDFPPEPMDSWEIPGRIDLGKPEAAGGVPGEFIWVRHSASEQTGWYWGPDVRSKPSPQLVPRVFFFKLCFWSMERRNKHAVKNRISLSLHIETQRRNQNRTPRFQPSKLLKNPDEFLPSEFLPLAFFFIFYQRFHHICRVFQHNSTDFHRFSSCFNEFPIGFARSLP